MLLESGGYQHCKEICGKPTRDADWFSIGHLSYTSWTAVRLG